MKSAAIILWTLQVIASLVALVAAIANFESIIVTGPALAATGLPILTIDRAAHIWCADFETANLTRAVFLSSAARRR